MTRTRTDQPWTLAIQEMLADGEWHNYQEIVRAASMMVPEEDAFEKAEYYRNYHYRKQGLDSAERRYGERADTIRTGQRFIVSKAIQGLRRRGVVEVAYEDGDQRKRKRPAKIRLNGQHIQ